MRELADIYESARVSVPLRTFPERGALVAWDELDRRVRSELDVLQERIFSALRGDERLLANHHRVIGEFNRGVRDGFLSGTADAARTMGSALTRSPFQWGQIVGLQRKEEDHDSVSLIMQFITVTHLLAYEFKQLDFAFARPRDFLMRNIGPDRADEFGELVFAVPILLNYRRELVTRIIDEPDFPFSEYHIKQPPAPSHLEYLSQGIVALFDPEPKSWIRVAANLGLATLPFIDGTTLQSEDFQAPQQVAEVTANKPITARLIVRRQMDRIELARRWIGSDVGAIELAEQDHPRTTLWDVYQSTQAAAIRGHGSYFADVVANNVASLLSEHAEAALTPQNTRLEYARRHLPAFTRGFDARSDRVVDVRAIASAQFGRNLSDALRRFENGGLYVAGVSQALAELDATVNKLHHAIDNFLAFVRNELYTNEETDLAEQLTKLFDAYPTLPEELFAENMQYEFFSRTRIQTRSPFDLMRSVLFHVVQAMQPSNQQPDSVQHLLSNARLTLRFLVELGDAPRAPESGNKDKNKDASVYYVVGGQDSQDKALPAEVLIISVARHFEREFETLTRVIGRIARPLHMARMLNKKHMSSQPNYANSFGQRGVS